jgi:hypothetical protein
LALISLIRRYRQGERRVPATRQSMIPKSGHRFSGKIMLKQQAKSEMVIQPNHISL